MSALADQLAAAGHDLNQHPHGLLVLGSTADEDGRAATEAAAQVTRQVFGAIRCSWQPAHPSHCAVVLPTRSAGVWDAATRAAGAGREQFHAVVVVRTPVRGAEALRQHYREAVFDLSLAQRIGGDQALFLPGDLVPWRMLSLLDDEDKRRLTAPLARIFGLRPQDRDAYLRTIEVFFEHGRYEAAARVLSVHVNSVRRRLERIADLTRCSMLDPGGRSG